MKQDKKSVDLVRVDYKNPTYEDIINPKFNWNRVTTRLRLPIETLTKLIEHPDPSGRIRDKLSRHCYFNKETLNKFHDKLNMTEVCKKQQIPFEILKHMKKTDNKVFWQHVSYYQNLNLEQLIYFEELLNWGYDGLSYRQKLTMEILERFNSRWDFRELSKNKTLCIEAIEKYKDKLDWKYLTCSKMFPLPVLKKFVKYVDWDLLSRKENLPLDVLQEFSELIDFREVSYSHTIDLKFLYTFKDKLSWSTITPRAIDHMIEFHSNDLLDLMEQYKDYWDWNRLNGISYLPIEILRRFRENLDWTELIEKTTILSDEDNNLIFKHAAEFKQEILQSLSSLSSYTAATFLSFFLHDDVKELFKEDIVIMQGCGKYNRDIFITRGNPHEIVVGCFRGSEEKTIKRIELHYGKTTKASLEYQDKVRQCFKTARELFKIS